MTMTQAPTTVSSQAERSASGYTLRVIEDTWLKLAPAQSSALPAAQKQLIRASATYPISSVQSVSEDHLRITFSADITGTLQLRGYDTWYVYGPAVQILRNGQPVSLAQVAITAPSSIASSMATYTLRIAIDTWLKQSTAQGSTLPDNQRQFVSAGTVLPLSGFKQVENDHILVTLGMNAQGNQVFLQGRNTWYIYRLAAQVLRDGQVILGLMNPPPAPMPAPPAPTPTPPAPVPTPTASTYTAKLLSDTWLKQSTGQGSTLPDDQRQFVDAGTVLPIAAYTSAPNDHLKLTLGTNNQGQSVQFKGRNTWYVYRPTVQILRNGRPIDGGTPTPSPSPSGIRQINADGLRLLKSFEGLRLQAYQDSVGVWTIGYGTTSGVRPGQVITEAQAEALLKRDLDRFEAAVDDLVNVTINSDQFSALVSFAYNVGEGALASSTLLSLLNRRDYQGAADQFLRWNRAGGAELAGLTRRRRAERALFLGQDYTVFL